MAETLSIQITARDGATQVFQAVASSAKTMGDAVEQAGKSGSGFTTLTEQVKALDAEIQTVGKSLTGMGAALTGALAVPMALGTKAAWGQVDAVQQATVALRAYEKDAAKVDEVLQSLVAYARSDMGVLFQRQDLFAAAQGLKVMGAETDNLVRYVEIMSRSVAIGAGTWHELEQVIGRVGSTGQLTGVEFDNLTKMGFQLDNSLRNSVVTWEELFDALNKGIPEVGGALDTIEGQTIRFQSALRGLGLAILQVDADTSQFIEGGLGDRLYHGIGQATELLNGMRPAAAAVGEAAALVAQGVGAMVTAFAGLPSEAQTLLTLLTGVSGAAMTAAGSMMLIVPKVLEFRSALTALRASSGALGAIAMAAGPVTLGLGALAAAGYVAWTSFQKGREASKGLEDALIQLGDVSTNLRLGHRDQEASWVDEFRRDIEEATAIGAKWRDDYDMMMGLSQTRAQREGYQWTIDKVYELQEAYEVTGDHAIAFANAQTAIGHAFADSRIDHAALNAELTSLRDQYDAELITLDEYADGVIRISGELDTFRASADGATSSLAGFMSELYMLTADGSGAADSVASLDEALSILETGLADGSVNMAEFTRIRGDLNKAIAEGSMTEERAAEILIDYANATLEASDATREFGTAIAEGLTGKADETLAKIEALEELTSEFRDLFYDLGGIDFARQVNLAGLGTEATHAAQGIRDVGAALDSVLTIYGAIDSLAGRMSQAGGIVDALFGPDGDPWDGVGPMRDVFDAGLISVEQFNQAIEDGISIQDAAAESQLYLNKMRVDQLPLLEETTQAYLDQIKAISDLGAEEQMVALGWMDSGMQDRVEQFTDMISMMGRLGPDGAAAMQQIVDGIAATDPVLTAMLEDLGLIERQLDGSYTLDLDAAGAVSEIDMLNTTLGHLIDTLNKDELGTYKLSIETELEEPGEPNWAKDGYAPGLAAVKVPVEFDFASLGASVGTGVKGAALEALGLAQDAVTVTVSQTGAEETQTALDTVTDAANAIPESESVDVSAPGAVSATAEINAVTTAANAVPDAVSVSVSANGAVGATAALYAVAAAALSIPTEVTTTIRTVRLGTDNNVLPGGRHGGIPGYAMGGVLFEGGEAGPEIAHFANGGMALLPSHGLYEAPHGTYISPNNTVGKVSTGGISVTFTGNFYGSNRQELDQWAAQSLVPNLKRVLEDERRGLVS